MRDRAAVQARVRADAALGRWVDEADAALGAEPSIDAVRVVFARAARALADGPDDPRPWRRRDVARAELLARVLERLHAERGRELVATLLRRGEIGEQESLLRGLGTLPDAERFVELATDACRTNSVSVFAAIANDNPYPAACFSDAAFDQMVLKAIFVGVPVERIVDLPRRVTPETVRMVRAYASERRAAGRAVPADVDYIVALSPEEDTK